MKKRSFQVILCLTAVLVMLPISVISAVIYILRGQFNFSVTLPVLIGSVGGGALGAILLKKLKSWNIFKYTRTRKGQCSYTNIWKIKSRNKGLIKIMTIKNKIENSIK